MEKQLKCVLLLSLKEMALRKVMVILWSDSDILAFISKLQFDMLTPDEIETEWRETAEDKVKDKVAKLELPESLKKQMIDVVYPIGLEIGRWKESHEDYFLDSWDQIIAPDLAKLCWTAAGTIDCRKTAEKLIHCDVLYVVQSYRLACDYCLEDYIPLLWEEVPEWMKDQFCNYKGLSPHLKFCWPYILKGEQSKLDYLLRTSDRNLTTFNQYAFEYSAENGNKTATEYFFHKLTDEERENSLMRTTHAVVAAIQNISPSEYFEDSPKDSPKFSSVLCYLLSVMTPVQQMEIFESRPVDILFSFLDWPWQDLFSENAGLIWTFLPPSNYGDLLWRMADRYTKADFYLPKLFQEVFVQSPLGFKKSFVDKEPEFNYISACDFLSLLFDFDDSETIGVIFRNVDGADRVKLVCHPHVLEQFYYCMLEDRWHMVEVCLREAMLSKQNRERLKETFMGFLKSNITGEIEWENQNLKRFFEFLDEADASADKQKKAQKRKLENCCAE
ncbi:hypothetical protein AVEN_68597-1 [Araneus ventricosus]|uniref:Uncharacterized protein n=1 Tax=Araneus ventricosus TaxID=182803 RepID=A0A4Y2QYQ0_ARAVE|nr:hypothetical protein AVEN_68597-1 [Araneus ventricosus]